MPKSNPILSSYIAHRGASAYAAENTMTALYKALAMGAKAIEVDVASTQDGELVLFHDDTLERCIGNTTELYKIDFDPLNLLMQQAPKLYGQYPAEAVATLEQALDFCKAHKVTLNIELKGFNKPNYDYGPFSPQQFWEKVKKTVEESGLEKGKYIYSSFDFKLLEIINSEEVVPAFGVLMHKWSDELLNWTKKSHATTLHVNQSLLNAESVAELKKIGLPIYSYTVNQTHRAEELLGWGVSGVFTDHPQLC